MFVHERVISACLLSCLLTSPTVLPEPSLGRGLSQLAEAARGAGTLPCSSMQWSHCFWGLCCRVCPGLPFCFAC